MTAKEEAEAIAALLVARWEEYQELRDSGDRRAVRDFIEELELIAEGEN